MQQVLEPFQRLVDRNRCTQQRLIKFDVSISIECPVFVLRRRCLLVTAVCADHNFLELSRDQD